MSEANLERKTNYIYLDGRGVRNFVAINSKRILITFMKGWDFIVRKHPFFANINVIQYQNINEMLETKTCHCFFCCG